MAPKANLIAMHDPSYPTHPTHPPNNNNIPNMNGSGGQQHYNTQTTTNINNNSSSGSVRSGTSASERSGRSRQKQDPPHNYKNQNNDARTARARTMVKQTSFKGATAPSHPSAAVVARSQQRRRPTNYTSSYTPPASLVAHARAARDAHANKVETKASSSSRRKCTSLDRSEDDGDERRSHLNGGGRTIIHQQHHQMQMQRHSMHEQQQMAQMQRDQQIQYAKQQATGQQQRHSMHEQQQHLQENYYYQNNQKVAAASSQSVVSGRPSSSRRSSQEGRTAEATGRRSSQEGQYAGAGSSPSRSGHQQKSFHSHGSNQSYGSAAAQASVASSRHSNSSSSTQQRVNNSTIVAASSSPRNHPSSRHYTTSSSSNQSVQSESSEQTEQQRIEEYAGKRALLRLEQELADHSESQKSEDSRQFNSVMDRKKVARVPQVKKSDLIIGEYLGRGNFCDVFEVTWIPEQQRTAAGNNGWSSNRTLSTYDSEEPEENLEASMDSLALSCSNDLNLVRGPNGEGGRRDGGGRGGSASRRSVSQVTGNFRGQNGALMRMSGRGAAAGGVGGGANRAATDALRNSFRNSHLGNSLRNPNVLALKCLRPAVRAQPRKFVIGAEDLAHETAILACLDHPNIIQLYGRAEGCFSTAFQMRNKSNSSSNDERGESPREGGSRGKQMSNEGYFIILDRLMTTLTDRIDEWKDECRAINGVASRDGSPVQMPPESTLREHLCKRLRVAYSIADALEYLDSRHVVFRDLKPANVGFDCNDCVKMFDFGFATSIAPLLSQPYEGYGPLTETCGTRRYMAPEVALKLGYGKEVDVYSFGMLLWEICALDKPFDSIQSVDEFHDFVVLCGRRPSLNIDPLWTPSLKNLMCRCWSTDPLDRPTMVQVKSLLCNVLRDMNKAMESRASGSGANGGNNGGGRGGGGAQGRWGDKWRRRVSI